ncbi:hypothetical protein Tco_0236300 [Tanacetum coccineum]
MNENKSFNRNPANHALYHALMEALIEDENAMDKGVADTVKNHKRQHDDDDDDDEDPSAGPNQGKKTKRRRTKDSKSAKKPSTTKETSKGKALSKSSKTVKFVTVEEPVKEPIAEVVMDDPVNTTAEDVVHDADQPHDDSTQAKDKASKQDWLKQPPGFTSVSVKKLHGYGHLEEIVVKRADQQLYKFKEGDFMDLHLNNIDDMMLLFSIIQAIHLNVSDIVDLLLLIYVHKKPQTYSKRRVDDLQLGVESYQKKLNITAPQSSFPEIEFKELFTPSYKPSGVIYEDVNKHKRVMRADELYKFLDGTLKTVRDELYHRILDFRLG